MPTTVHATTSGRDVLALLIVHLVAAIVAPFAISRWGRKAFAGLAFVPASAAVWALTQTSAVMDGNGPSTSTIWIPSYGLTIDLRLDTLSWLMTIIVGGIGALVVFYCTRYFSKSASSQMRFAGVLMAFIGSMLGLVLADNLLLLYVFWELTTVFSYLLIGHYIDRKASRRAAMEAIIITTAGGLAMLTGFLVLGHEAGTYTISEIVSHPPSGTAVTIAIVAILAGALSKSAIFPFHFWLPAAMAAPTPVSAYLHAAAMVKAGIYLIARMAPGFAELPAWQVIVLVLGGWTMLLGGWRALRQHDLKTLLAYGTVSQLGLIAVLVGAGTQAAALAGLALLLAHALFKAALFLIVGLIDVSTGTRDLRVLSGLGRKMPLVAVAAGLAVASMIALPPLTGFVAKEAALAAIIDGGTAAGVTTHGVDLAVFAVIVVGSVLTFAYGLRFMWGAFASKPGVPASVALRPSWVLVAPPVVLAAGSLILGLIPGVENKVLIPYALTYPVYVDDAGVTHGAIEELSLWHGFSAAFLATLLVIGAGLAAFTLRSKIFRLQERLQSPIELDYAYRRSLRLLDRIAAAVTGWTQRGSLPFYLGTILTVVVLGGGGAAIYAGMNGAWPTGDKVQLWDSPAQLVTGAVICAAAIFTARARRRLKAVVLLGVTGYGGALLFLLHGAPDLALTQILVETITLVVFVLVMRKLSPYFSDRPLPRSRWVRLAIALAVGVTVSIMALVVPGSRVAPPASELFPDEAVAFGYGNNIVNVTLVDIRAWDTMGEISVLLVAATGVASLIFVNRRQGDMMRADRALATGQTVWRGRPDPLAPLRNYESDERDGDRSRVWLAAGQTLAIARRSLIFEVVTRLLFHTMIVFSIYLLFSGHNAPGGGFAAGLVVGLALTIRYLAGGRYELVEAAPIPPGVLLGAGLFLSAGVGLAGLLVGVQVLQSTVLNFTLPIFGDVHLVTSMFFDIGVYLVVIGLVLDILRSLGSEIDRQLDDEELEQAQSRAEGNQNPRISMDALGQNVVAPAREVEK